MSQDASLREKFQIYAEGAPTSVGLLDAVRRRSRRRRLHLRAGAAGLALILAASGAMAGRLLLYPDAASGLAASSAVVLVAPTFEVPPFPMTPGWAPGGLGEPAVGFSEGGMWLQYPGFAGIYVEVTLRGSVLKPAASGVRRQLPDGRWLTVAGTASTEDLGRFLDSMVPTPIPVPVPFTFDLVPAGVEPVLVQGTTTGFLPPMMQFRSADGRINVYVDLAPGSQRPVASIAVGGVPVPADVLSRFTSGIHLTDHAAHE